MDELNRQNDSAILEGALRKRLTALVAGLLRVDDAALSPSEPLSHYGLSPSQALQIARQLDAIFTQISVTFLYEHPSIAAMAAHLLATQHAGVLSWLNTAPGEHSNTGQPPDALVNSSHAEPAFADTGRADAALRAATQLFLRELIGTTLKIAPDKLNEQKPFNEYGFNSIAIMSIIQDLEDIFDDLPVTLFFEHFTLESVTDYLLEHYPQVLKRRFGLTAEATSANIISSAAAAPPLAEATSPDATPQPAGPVLPAVKPEACADASAQQVAATDIAIIGLDGRYPGADDIRAFWRNLVDNTDCISEIPAERWNWRDYDTPEKGIQGRIYSRWGGFIRDVDCFDPLFFNLSPFAAEQMDPSERLFMQSAWGALEDAGYTRDTLDSQHRVGVFAGTTVEEYLPWSLHENLGLFMGNSAALANRVSFFCNFTGPSLTLNTMCSSSLSAIYLACQSLAQGECAAAIAGAVNLSLHPSKYAYLSHKQFLSTHGRCKAFCADGNGYVPGEGVGTVVLKPLARAQADGDHIYGVIKGIALNHGGKTNGYSVPSPQAQADVITQALRHAGVEPRAISYIEAHGTGTRLGDPIEIEGLQRALGRHTADKQFCSIGSVKTNVGHCESAAGMAGLTKVLLQMQHGVLVKSLHSEPLSPAIKFADTPFYVQQENAPWGRPTLCLDGETRVYPRIAGLSSFGAGGSNAHLIIEEAPPASDTGAQGAVLVVLSAQIPAQLHARLAQLCDFLTSNSVTLADLAWTLQAGREAMPARLAVVVDSTEALAKTLRAVLAGSTPVCTVYEGRAEAVLPTSVEAARWLSDGELGKLASVWVRGITLDWTALYPHALPRRLSLPTYPFARERCWLPSLAPQAPAALHPLVHSNTADVSGLCYRTRFTGQEAFLRDHQVHGKPVLPAAAQLVAIRAALALAGVQDVALQDVIWQHPLAIAQARDICIALRPDSDDSVEFELYGEENAQRQVYCRGRTGQAEEHEAQLDIATLCAACQPVGDLEQKYAHFLTQGIFFGPALRGLSAAWSGEGIAIGTLDLRACNLPPELRGIALIDGAFHTCAVLGGFSNLLVPFTLAQGNIASELPEQAYAVVRESAGEYNITLTHTDGQVFMQLNGVSLRALDGDEALPALMLATPCWRAQQPGPVASLGALWTLLCEAPLPAGLDVYLNAARVVTLTALGSAAQRYAAHAQTLLTLLKAPAIQKADGPVTLQLVVGDSGEAALMLGLAQLLHSAALELPSLRVQAVVLENDPLLTVRQQAERLYAEAQQSAASVRYRAGQRLVADWDDAQTSAPVTLWRDEGVYWLTGGLGGLGQHIARSIARAVRNPVIIFSSRREPDGAQCQFMDELCAQGARVAFYPLDVSDATAVAQTVSAIVETFGYINGVLHGAGVQHDGLVRHLDASVLHELMVAKVAGTEALDRALGELPLDWLVLCSTLSAVRGNLGQGGYAAANAFLDNYAHYRQQQVAQGDKRGLTVAINWPLLAEAGMQLDAAQQAIIRQNFGLVAMPCAQGMPVLERAIAAAATRVAVLYGEREKLIHLLSPEDAPSYAPEDAPDYAPAPPAQTGGSPREQLACVVGYLKNSLASVIKLPAARIDSATPLEKYGFDSVMTVLWGQALGKTLGKLPVSALFDNRSVDDLARYLLRHYPDRLTGLFEHLSPPAPVSAMRPDPARVEPASPAPRPASVHGEDIAIIGLSGRYPQADCLEQFWQNLVDGRNCITEIPPERWDWREDFDAQRGVAGKNACRWGGFINGVDTFDPLFFQILPSDAARIDPQERLFMQCAWHAIEDAGYTRASLVPDEARLAGVFVGVMTDDYALYTPKRGEGAASPVLQGVSASIANRVSWFCNFHGPSLAVNTMCSSSLTAIHLACQSLRQGECSVALAGGVNAIVHPNKYLLLSETGFISTQGRCASFANGGDGYVPAEGVGAVVLKPLARAQADGDRIYAVIKGSSLNHGGKTQGYTVPNPQAQSQLITRALHAAGVSPRAISYLEAHGTGTALGDPIEIEALSQAFAAHTQDRQFCAIGSVKSNIGHAESAAGIAGLSKILLQMRHGQLVKSLHGEVINPHIDFAQTPFTLVQENQPWPRDADGRPRLAGLSSFGAGGANAHLIVEEYLPDSERQASGKPVLIVLSAHTAQGLHQQRTQLADAVAHSELSFDELAWTLQTGREAMTHRLALIADSREALIAQLLAPEGSAGVYQGELGREPGIKALLGDDDDLRQFCDRWVDSRRLDKLALLWVQGLEIDWRRLWGAQPPARVSLPGYPFAREHCWFSPQALAGKAHAGTLHPLVHRNTSTFERQRYSTHLSGQTWFLTGHRVRGVALVPGVLQLEWARAAVSLALENQTVTRLEQVMWLRPLAVSIERDVDITLLPQADGRISFEIYAADDEACIFSRGYAVPGASPVPAPWDLSAQQARCDGLLTSEALYLGFAQAGLDYGPRLRLLTAVHTGPGLALGTLLAQTPQMADGLWPVAPLDAALQSGAGLLNERTLLLPLAVEAVESWSHTAAPAYTVVVAAPGGTAALRKWDIVLVDAQGNVCVQMQGVTLREAPEGGNTVAQNAPTPDRIAASAGDNAIAQTGGFSLATHGDSAITQPLPSSGKDYAEAENAVAQEFYATDNVIAVQTPATPAAQFQSCATGDNEAVLQQDIERILTDLIAGTLNLPASELDRHAPFAEFGFDSINLGTLGAELNARFALDLSTTVFFEAPTIAALAAKLAAEHRAVFTSVPANPVQPVAVQTNAERERAPAAVPLPAWHHRLTPPAPEPVAIIGMSGCFPQAPDLDTLWARLCAGEDCISELPRSRWQGQHGQPRAGVLHDIAGFDPLFFGISPREALAMDPQQRLLMMYVHHALEDAGYSAQSLSGSNTALLVGTASTGYGQRLSQAGVAVAGYSTAGQVSSIGPNRMSYWLNWHGPSEPVETACSSSLVAVHRAMTLLRSGQCDMAVVGGINTLISQDAQESFAQAGMLSPDGRCKPFSARADGYVRSEGVGMLVLKPLHAAQRDGDHIAGLLLGSAENHGGRAASLTAPNPNAQASVIEAALRQAGVAPATLGYIETHGTGTPLGDPVEIHGLQQAFSALSGGQAQGVAYCGLGSVKGNIGHTEMAAGVAGIIKVLLQMRHRTLAASLYCMPTNPEITLDNGPFRLVSATGPWPALYDKTGQALARRAGVNSFGFGGVNAHVVMEEYVAPARARAPTPQGGLVLIVLSAQNDEALRQRAQALRDWLLRGAQNLTDLAWTLQVGRDAMKVRLALATDDQQALIARLGAWLAGNDDGVWRSRPGTSERTAPPSAHSDIATLGNAWVNGAQIDWRARYTHTPQRLSLPTYPFALTPYWPQLQALGEAHRLHPLIGRNTSTLHEQRYTTTLTGEETFLRDHQIGGRALVPGAVMLAWAQAAVSLAQEDAPAALANVIWLRPLDIITATDVHIALEPQADGRIRFDLYSDGEHEDILYCQGDTLTSADPAPGAAGFSPAAELDQASALIDADTFYARMAQQGLCFGDSLRVVQRVSVQADRALSELAVDGAGEYADGWLPAILDGAMQTVAALLGPQAVAAYPFALHRVTGWQRMAARLWVQVTRARVHREGLHAWNIVILDEQGNAVLAFDEVSFRESPAHNVEPASE